MVSFSQLQPKSSYSNVLLRGGFSFYDLVNPEHVISAGQTKIAAKICFYDLVNPEHVISAGQTKIAATSWYRVLYPAVQQTEFILSHHQVISKTTRTSKGGQKYQRLTLRDEKGMTMKAVLFGHNVDYFDEIITEDRFYDMSNVIVSPVDPSYQSYPGEQQIHINTSCSIKKVDTGESSSLFNAKLSTISDLPRETLPYNATFDLLVVVLHYNPMRKVFNKKTGTESDLTELYVTDDSCSDAVLLSLWNEHAVACEEFARTDPCGTVILVNGVKTKDFNGFSLSTTSCSKIEFNPIGPRVTALRNWFAANRDSVLTETGIITMKKERLPADIPITSIHDALGMKVKDVTAGDVLKVAAYVPDFTARTVRLTLSCNLCGKASNVPPDVSFLCDKCQNHSFSTARIFFDFTATDGTGTMKLSASSRTAKQLLKIAPNDFCKLTDKERATFADKTSTALRSKKIELLLSPVPTFLTDHNQLVWRLKDIL